MMRTNIGTVIAFEVRRTLKSKGFWIAGLMVPILFAVVIFIARSGSTAVGGPVIMEFEYTDASGLIDPQVAQSLGGTLIADPAQGLDDVKAGHVDAFIEVPADPVTQPVVVAGQDRGVAQTGIYQAIAGQLVQESAAKKVGDPALVALASGQVNTDVTTYKNGVVSNSIGQFIPPLLFLIAFYLTMLIQSNRMIGSALEEKQNRVTEMILTTIKSSSLLAGKVISLIIVGVIQMLLTILPTVVVVLILRGSGQFTWLNLSMLSFDPQRMIMGSLLLVSGFLLFTAGLVAIGAALPTEKEAQSMYAVVLLVLLSPIFLITQILTNPDAGVVRVFTYFPVTAPMTAMIRNALGALGWGPGLGVTAVVLAATWVVFQVAVRVYQYGSAEYSRKVSLKLALQRP